MGYRTAILFCLIVAFHVSGQVSPLVAQCATDTLFWLDFQNQQIPTSWANLDEDSLVDQANRPNNWFVQADPLSGSSTAPNYVANSNSWFAPAGQADNWLISERFLVCDSNLFMVWKSAPFEGPVYMDGYEVLLATGSGSLDSFTVNLATFAEGIDATAQSSAGTVHSAYDGNRGLLQGYRASLADWYGDTVTVAFRHTSTDDNLLLLDDIGAVVLPRVDAAVPAVSYNTAYPTIPVSQVVPMTFTATVSNPGIDTLPVVDLDMEMTRNGNAEFSVRDSVLNLAPEAHTSISTAMTYAPLQAGSYTFTTTAVNNPADGNASNDSGSISFVVDDSVYARDEGPVAGTRSIGSQAGFIGQTFQVFTSDTLTSISFYVEAPTGMDTLRGAIYQFGAAPGNLVALTDPWAVPANFTGWKTLGLAGIDLPLGTGTYLIGLEESAAGALNLGWTAGKTTGLTAWHRVGTVWASTDALDLDGTYMVRANFGVADELVAATPGWSAQDLSLFPNPSAGQFELRFVRPVPRTTRIEVRDLTGGAVRDFLVAGGTRQVDLDLTGQADGLYLLVLDGRAVGRMMVAK